jgi:flagella basal body P-ring formation protein FlgA
VTVYAKAAGIRIHTTARAKEEGAMGDLVAVESVADRKTFTARVCGPRETEVFAQAAAAE